MRTISAGDSPPTRISPMARSVKQDSTHVGLAKWFIFASQTATQIGRNASAVMIMPSADFWLVLGSLFHLRRTRNTIANLSPP